LSDAPAEAPARSLQCELEDAYEGDSDPIRPESTAYTRFFWHLSFQF
jgi:hypothetical protein